MFKKIAFRKYFNKTVIVSIHVLSSMQILITKYVLVQTEEEGGLVQVAKKRNLIFQSNNKTL